MLKFIEHSSIRSKILTITLVGGLPVMLVAVFQLYASYRSDYYEAEHAIKVTAAAIAYQHQANVEGIQNLLGTLAQFPEVKQKDPAACSGLLKKVLRQLPTSYNIGIADVQGSIIASAVSGKFSIGDRKYFRDAVRTKRFSVGEYTVSRAVGKPALHFAQPVLDERGEVSVVIYAAYDLNSFNSIFASQKLPPNSALNITDHRGVLIHRYPPHPVVRPGTVDRPDLQAHMTGAHDEGAFNDFGRDNVKRLLAFKRLRLHSDEAPYLYARVSIPEEEAFSATRNFIILSLSFFLLAWGIALFLSRRLAARYLFVPLERITHVAQAAKKGDFSSRTDLSYSEDEIGMLAHSIDSMSEALEVRRRERELAEAEQRRMQQELQESERRLRELLENVHLVAVILDGEKNITFCNDYLLKVTGWTREEVLGRNWFDLFIPEDDLQSVQSVFDEGVRQSAFLPHHENPIKTRRGESRLIVWDNTLLRGSDGNVVGTASIGIDVTEQRIMEEQLLHARKMEAVGKLAGGVAHDFNNLMTPILGYADLVRGELESLGGRVDRIGHIINAAMKARDLTRQLLSFSRKQPLNMQVLDLNAVVSSFVGILRRTVRESIEIRLELLERPAWIRVDRTQIEMVIMNLVVNAQDAIDVTGEILIETRRVGLDDEYAALYADVAPGEYIMLSVSDNGKGIDQNVLDHIFEPFFTTRSATGGTGLGLATVYGVVKQHSGHVVAHSEPGNGSMFKVYIPALEGVAEAEVITDESSGVPSPLPSAGKKNILLVEDNDMVREMVHELLIALGHDAVVAENPLRALELVSEGPVPELLVTDVVMPGMSGPELYRALQERHPGIKALFMSGYTNSFAVEHVELQEGYNFIQKPFALSVMAERITEILTAGTSS
ncbi:ATP-binding protein [Geobacter sp. DSM 9736]|uniref:ATP-binding protein n=1 Tax=Geobacter sp. DSM 9736 TaxID=1277350 RepID=UPI001E60857C|nr:ATP-binding protein [Geobacter sp. DSM 9736]